MNKLMRIDDVAAATMVHRETVLRWVRSGSLPAGKAGREYRIWEADLIKFMKFPRPTGRPPGRKKKTVSHTGKIGKRSKD